ncbi:MAG: zf-HC2 domain-containing protein [Vicinamibacterales bacterium]|nr:zf-HC2 domain-containing protein [Vicinamibacterales bacterium]
MDPWTDRLSEYIDNELTPADRAACEAHLAGCAGCRDTVTAIVALTAHAQRLPDRGPGVDLWPAVLARLTPVAPAATPMAARRWSLSLGELALAATLLMAVSAGLGWLAAQRPGGGGQEDAVIAVSEPSTVSDDVQLASFADEDYDAAVTDLELVLLEQRDELDPQTVRVIERNLQTIDEAIRQARQALDDDPANPYLHSYLVDSRRRKLDLLRRATLLTTVSQGD